MNHRIGQLDHSGTGRKIRAPLKTFSVIRHPHL
jgi:hypothetical protein